MKRKAIPSGRLTAVLEQIPRGIERPVTVTEISKATGIPRRNIYECINLLIMQYDVPIGGVRSKGRRGIFIATNEAERAAAVTPLANSAREIQRRVNKLQQMEL